MAMTQSSSRFFGVGLAVLIGLFSLAIQDKPSDPPNPNIILLSADTLRADHLGCYGYARETSPNIDAFSKDSVVFQNAISQAPTTVPAHMSIFTSLTPLVHLCKFSSDNTRKKGPEALRLNEKIATLPLLLKEHGYWTMGLHGGGSMDGALGFDKGFDTYRLWQPYGRRGSMFEDVQEAIRESKEKKKPLFLFLHNYICHSSYLRSPPEYRLKFLSEEAAGLLMPQVDLKKINIAYFSNQMFWKKMDLSNPEHLKFVISLYDGSISYQDHVFGEILKILKKENIYDNSIIILLSDHGEEFYEHLGHGHGRLFIEDLHVPLIIKFPGQKFSGKMIRAWVRTMDLMPTLFDFLNIKIQNRIQGTSFLPLLMGKGGYAPLIVSFNLLNEYLDAVKVIQGPFAYNNEPIMTAKERLFDIKQDPSEMNNLAMKETKVTEQMRSLVREILSENKAFRERLGIPSVP